MRMVYAPWNPVFAQTGQLGVCVADEAFAKKIRENPGSYSFATGGDPLWAKLSKRYYLRSMVVISLESHRLSNVAPLGMGSYSYKAFSPCLEEWSKRGILFTNVFQVGQHTQTMAWSLLTGLPNHPEFDPSMYTPQLAAFGSAREFVRSGYQVSWLQATSTAFASNDQVLARAGVQHELRPEELQHHGDSSNTWGMHDRNLMRVAQGRVREWMEREQRYLLMVATVSNHPPFTLPDKDGVVYPQDNYGGMSFADNALNDFLIFWNGLPEDKRPLVYITADHTFRHDLAGAEPCGMNGLESIRLPGLLLLPDGAESGTQWGGLICHQDELDLLAHLTGDTGHAGVWKFRTYHRVAVGMLRGGSVSVLTADGFWEGESSRAWNITNRWTLSPADQDRRESLRSTAQMFTREINEIWPIVKY